MPTSSPASRTAAESREQLRKYFAKLPATARRPIKALADIIHKAAPGGVDVISYGIPAVRLNGRVFVWYAAWMHHLSLYPLSAEDRRIAESKGYKTSKGTLRMPLGNPLPVGLIRRVVKSRVAGLGAKRASPAPSRAR